MRHRTTGLLLLLLAGGCAGTTTPPCDDSSPTPNPVAVRPLTKLESNIVAADNSFGFTMLRELNSTKRDSNVFISPFSISMALGMTQNGAVGETRDEMRRTLGLEGLSDAEVNNSYRAIIDILRGIDSRVTFSVANSIWSQKGFDVEPDFIDVNRRFFDAEASSLDFGASSAAPTINGWVDRNTRGKIKEVVPNPLPSDAVMYLINAIYFKGTWRTQFNTKSTYDGEFQPLLGPAIPCRMMRRNDTVPYQSNEEFDAVDLPYGGGNYSMVVMVPNGRTTAEDLVNQLTPARWEEIVGNFRTTSMDVHLPRFKVEWGKDLVDALKTMGMQRPFAGADFSGISRSSGGSLQISSVMHKTFVEVNEEGTEAAAVTSVEIIRTSVPPSFRADRPFVVAIRERTTGAILFIGKIARV